MMSDWSPVLSRRVEVALVLGIVLAALVLRLVGHRFAPDGWREDELSNALVVSQHVRDGEVRLYYDDASGHEGLYHWLQAGTMALFGAGVLGVRGVSIGLGTLSVLLTYLLARRLFGWPVSAIAAAAMAVSFWSLMYSRAGQRHVSVLPTTLLSFYFLWKAVPVGGGSRRDGAHIGSYVLAGVWMGIGFYTYFASRGVPLAVAAWGFYLLVWRRDLWRAVWRGLVVALVVAGTLGAPLVVTLARQPHAEARVAELATPVYDARAGDFSTVGRYAVITLSMFTHDGDDEVLYNVPHRPVFGLLGGFLFWVGAVLALVRMFGPARDARHAFLLLWLGAGLAPGVLSVPAASLSHTILAQPVVMMLPALALTAGGQYLAQADDPTRSPDSRAFATMLAAGLMFLVWEGVRGVTDYWFVWPDDGFNRVLHHSDLHEAAEWLNAHPGNRNVAIGGFLNERWDQQVMRLDLEGEGWRVRAFDPRVAYLMFPGGGTAVLPEYLRGEWAAGYLGDAIPVRAPYGLYRVAEPGDFEALAIFDNGLSLVMSKIEPSAEGVMVTLGWRVERPLDLPPFPMLSKPPAPDEDDTPRLAIFVQALDEGGQRVAGTDGLGVDPYTLVVGDVFVQRMVIGAEGVPRGKYRLVTGLYDPASGLRHRDVFTGGDTVELGVWKKRP